MSPIYVPGKVTLAKDYIPVDPDFNSVSLLLHGNADGSGNILDSSPSPKTVSKFGDAASATPPSYPNSNSAFGNAIAFDGTGDALRILSDAKFGFGTGDFTVEFWLYYLGGNGYVFFWIQNIVSPTSPYLGYGLNSNSKNPWLWNNGDVLTTTTAISNNTWQHHAVVRNNGTLSIYLDGTAIGSTTFTADLGSSKPLSIGDNGGSTQFTNGYIDDFRITKGVARYTSNFTPPTTPFPDIASR